MSEQQGSVRQIIVTPTKSIVISLILTFLFGPLGMLYSTIWGAIIMIVISIIMVTVTLGFGAFVVWSMIWPISMIWGALAVVFYNKKLIALAASS